MDVRIRMYRQGLGDCFLLSFPNDAHVLIDCGVLKGTSGAQAQMRKVATNIAEVTNKRLALLVATHEHWDHLSGFLQAQEIFDTLSVGEVWLGWTENPKDDLARELDKRKKEAIKAAAAAAVRLRGLTDLGARSNAKRIDQLLGFFGDLGAAEAQTTGRALDWVKSRPNAAPQYLMPGGKPRAIPGVDAVRVYVLGPPYSSKLIKKSNPTKKGREVYELSESHGADVGFLAAVDTAIEPARRGSSHQPFDSWFGLSEEEARKDSFFERYSGGADEWRQIEDDWLGAATTLALKLDSNTNNTSLALAFELLPSERVLLFVGDAQVGNWLSWHDLTWEIPSETGTRQVKITDLLSRTVLYKVGHHGSHNATLREQGLELMTSDELTAMVPVNRKTAATMDWNMPFPSLFDRLVERTGGRILDAEQGIPPGVDTMAPQQAAQFLADSDVQPDWIDYHVSF
jgi:hypothetical protein